jgi:hypothetical protein
MFTNAEKLREVEREIGMRKRVYPSFVARGKLRQEDADRQIAIMQEVAEGLRITVDLERHMKARQLAL